MKRFILKVLLALLPLAAVFLSLWAYVWLCPMRYMDGEYPYWRQQKDYVHKMGAADDVICLGDSTMKAGIRPILVKGFGMANLAVGGGTTIESYYTLKTYIKYHGNPAAAVVGYHAIHYTQNECNIGRTLYFNYLNPIQIREVRREARRLHDVYWDAPDIDNVMWQYVLRLPNAYAVALKASKDGKRYEFNKSAYNLNNEERGYMHFSMAEGCFERSYITYWQDFTPNALIDLYLHRIMDLCAVNNIRLVLVQMPIEKESEQYTDSAVLRKIEEYFEGLQKEYPMHDIQTNMTWFDNNLFGDMNHLNSRGTEEFTNALAQRLVATRLASQR